MMNTQVEYVEYMNKLETFLNTTHPTSEYISLVKELTGVEFDNKHPMYDFYVAPASSKFHGCYPNGLVKHSLYVYYSALRLCAAFGMKPEEIDANACIFHDLVKANLYQPLKIGTGYTYNKDAITLPHGSESLRRMSKYGIKISNEAWEMAVAYHMGAFEHDNMSMYGNACEKYKEVLLLHTADMMATKIYKN